MTYPTYNSTIYTNYILITLSKKKSHDLSYIQLHHLHKLRIDPYNIGMALPGVHFNIQKYILC